MDLTTFDGDGLIRTPFSVFQGTFKDGQKLYGHLQKHTPQQYTGPFLNGLPHGSNGKQRMPGVFLEYVGEFWNGHRDGRGKLFWEQDTFYDGQFHNNLIYGKGRFVCPNFTIQEGAKFKQNDIAKPIFVSGQIISHQKILPKSLKTFGNEYRIKLHGQATFLFQQSILYSCKFDEGRIISFYDNTSPIRKTYFLNNYIFKQENKEQIKSSKQKFYQEIKKKIKHFQINQINPETLTGKMAMEWQYIDTHPSGLTGQLNLFYEGDVEHGQQHGHGVKTNKIDKTKYTGGFVRGKRQDDNATQIEIDQEKGHVQVYNGPFQNDEKHGLGQIIIQKQVYSVRYQKGVLKNKFLKDHKQNGNCKIF